MIPVATTWPKRRSKTKPCKNSRYFIACSDFLAFWNDSRAVESCISESLSRTALKVGWNSIQLRLLLHYKQMSRLRRGGKRDVGEIENIDLEFGGLLKVMGCGGTISTAFKKLKIDS